MRGELLYRGAEADVVRGKWRGIDAVYKVRTPLRYRHPLLDLSVRRQRTLREADMTHSAKKAGVYAPHIYDVDLQKFTIVMEYVRGWRLKELASSDISRALDLFEQLGRDAARLHSAGIMHGDLTTANVIGRDGKLVFLDFGLSLHSWRIEDHAVDLRLAKETITGAHASSAATALERLLGGYVGEAGESQGRRVLKQLQGIERRGRYARVV